MSTWKYNLRTAILSLLMACLLLWIGATRIVEAGKLESPTAQESSEVQELYEARCATCHGTLGDGAGPAADRFFIKPRDFTRDEYKIKSTAGDEFPSRDDLIRVISKGMPGSSMPPWENVLSQSEIGELADYIQAFGRFFPQEGYGTTIVEVPSRVEPSPESIARGKQLYEGEVECVKCHGLAGRGDGPSAFELTDNAGFVIYPADLTQPWTYRGGMTPEDVYLRMHTGLTGSPMPAFGDALTEEEIWDLVNFILSLSPEQAPEPSVLLVSDLVEGSLPDDPNDAAWLEVASAYYPLTSQLMRAPRFYRPAVNAVWVKSLYNGSEIAFHISWNDRTETRTGDAIDAMAIQWPQELSDGNERPYFVFGDPQRPAYQWYWTADSDTVAERNTTGLQSVTDQSGEQQTVANAVYEDGRWQVVFRRPLQTGDENDLRIVTDTYIPLNFIVWDGGSGEIDGQMGINTWSPVYLQSPTPATQYAAIPAVMLVVIVLQWLVVRLVRRFARTKENG
ncbi:c-type cytochrome [Chloroflexi bacterium TSY]|nr:c-type cytochrome [Chloroflexi bacterium TSY]